MKKKILISTSPFCEYSHTPYDLLEACPEIEFTNNPFGRKLSEAELAGLIGPFHGIIAGTELISEKVLRNAPNLKIISRVGVGLDSVDLLEARRRNIAVAYTAEAPALAVAELTIGLMLNLLRKISQSDRFMREGHWKRFFGGRIGGATIGIIGCGRIGKLVAKRLQVFDPKQILVYDIKPVKVDGVVQVPLDLLLQESDVISLHTPLTKQTVNLINNASFKLMKSNSLIINTARGGIINEADLLAALNNNTIQGAAIDVFEQEPYTGPLSQLNNCILTSHMGSMSFDCRTRMEIEATQDLIHFFKTSQLLQPVPEHEYDLKKN